MQLDRLACIATRSYGGRQPVMSSASAMSGMSAPPSMLMTPLDLDMNVYSRHFGDQPHGAMDLMVMQQQMAAGQQRDQHAFHDGVLTDDNRGDPLADGADHLL
jgi:hypothetical protein